MADTARESLLRLEVGRLRARMSLRRFEASVHVGTLGAGDGTSCPVPSLDPVLDAGTRTDVLLRLLEEDTAGHGEPACVRLVRPGEPVLEDDDLAWLAAALRACDTLGRRLDGMWVVTRTGWLDVCTGERRTWKRLRLT